MKSEFWTDSYQQSTQTTQTSLNNQILNMNFGPTGKINRKTMEQSRAADKNWTRDWDEKGKKENEKLASPGRLLLLLLAF
jgi:hypothetical protein